MSTPALRNPAHPSTMRAHLSDVWFRYGPDEPWVFEGLNLTVESHSVHSVVGVTGCGKSTLLRLIAGLEAPHSGTVRVVGAQHRPNRTAMVFQDPALIPWWTTGRNVGIGMEMGPHNVTGRLYRKIRDYSLERVGLKGTALRMSGTLSHGMKKRAALARSLAHDAEVMLLDEPFVHLDFVTRRNLWTELETVWRIDPRTYVLVTHDIEEAVLLSDRVTVLSAGGRICETVEVGVSRPRSPDDLTSPAVRSAMGRVWEALERSSRT